jgi:hypothetical protein
MKERRRTLTARRQPERNGGLSDEGTKRKRTRREKQDKTDN